MSSRLFLALLVVLVVKLSDVHSEDDDDESHSTPDEDSADSEPVDEEKVEYARGSVCGYCTYCKVNISTHLLSLKQGVAFATNLKIAGCKFS